jgi:hypothetical protein
MNGEWTKWFGTPPAHPVGTRLEVELSSGKRVIVTGEFNWVDCDVARYRIVGEPTRSTNPKDAIGSVKLPLHLWPAEATALGCLGMLEGKCKYGRNNYIEGDGVIASIYIDAAMRHLFAWFSGEEFNPDLVFAEDGEPGFGLSHLGNALATIAIVVKAQAHGKLIDDRDFSGSPGAYRKLVDSLTPLVKNIQNKFIDKTPHHYTIADNEADQ